MSKKDQEVVPRNKLVAIMRSTLSIFTSLVLKAYLMVLVFPLCYGQNLKDPEFINESSIVQIMLSDSAKSYSNDTISIHLGYYYNGSLKEKRVYYHPDGAPKEMWLYSYLSYAVSRYHENGKIALYAEWLNNKLNGDYLQYDSERFVTHWVYENGVLVDVKNDNCRYLDPKGKIISKEDFFNQFESEGYGQWGYYFFAKEFEPYSRLNCCDFVMYSDKFPIPSEGKAAEKLIKRLNKTCY